MSELTPRPPGNWRVTGVLHDTEFPELLCASMAEFSYPGSDFLICAGWEPEEDPSGHYVVYVLRGCDMWRKPQSASSLQDAEHLMQELAEQFTNSAATTIAESTPQSAESEWAIQNTAVNVVHQRHEDAAPMLFEEKQAR